MKQLKDNLADHVIEHVKNKILCGDYVPGDHLPETEIAKELGISRAPVREGIRELQNLGVVKFLPRRGNYISQIEKEDVLEIFDIRIMIESDMFRILIEENKLTKEDFEALDGIVKDMVAISESKGDITEKTMQMSEKDIQFHRYLWDCSGSMRRKEILERLNFQLQMAMVIDTKESGNLKTTATEHYDIIKGLKMKDIEVCKKALIAHIFMYGDN